ncbi:PREDICTED: uncharacterized protein LOC109581114 [Amphimedon queenslandica]|uniref:Death domain-containing protein n=1 Tax=Amphimedon queenslandica TaxID=400682 RepID=A0A1X7V696_AMPQE|nr:PREDICTED: uncharacterized protein LOC109581114 [Amphimedon queenslandica]|eukprot:XP_019850462.1 PREDICTED: uncharacterized protein LOC109581114 [Amphimedon queenslandica]
MKTLVLLLCAITSALVSRSSADNSIDPSQLIDVVDVLKRCGFPYVRWFDLGLKLGLLKTTLDTIEKTHIGDIPRCLTECLSKWLSRFDNVDQKGGATWESLSKAIRSIDEIAVADKLNEEIHRLHSHVNSNAGIFDGHHKEEVFSNDQKKKEKHNTVNFDDVLDMLQKGVKVANKLLGENGEIQRGDGKSPIKWNIQGTRRGFEWMWIGTCYDTKTGITEVHTKQSRDGALEHCLTALFKKI